MNYQKKYQNFTKASLISMVVAIMCLSTWVMAQDPVVMKVVDESGDSTIQADASGNAEIFIELENVEVYYGEPAGAPPYAPEDIQGVKAIQFALTYDPNELSINIIDENGTLIPDVTVFDTTALEGEGLEPWPVYAHIVVDGAGDPVGTLNIDLAMNPANPNDFRQEWYDPPPYEVDPPNALEGEFIPPNDPGIYALDRSGFILNIGATCLGSPLEGTPVNIVMLKDENGDDLDIFNEQTKDPIPVVTEGGTVVCGQVVVPLLRIHPESREPDVICFSPGSSGELEVWVDTMGIEIIGCAIHLTVTHSPDDGISKVLEFQDTEPFVLGDFLPTTPVPTVFLNTITSDGLEDQLNYNAIIIASPPIPSNSGQGVLVRIPYTVMAIGSVTIDFDFDADNDRETGLVDKDSEKVDVSVLSPAAEYCVRPGFSIYITSLPLKGYKATCAPIDFSICQDGAVVFEETKVVEFPVDATEENRVELQLNPDDIQADKTVRVVAKNWHYLASASDEVLISGGLEVEIPEAKGGDANNDNKTNFFGDVLVLAGNFNQNNEQPCDYLPEPDAPKEPWHADFNQDGKVNFFGDVLMLAGNFNKQGFNCVVGAPSVVDTEGSNSNAAFQLLVNGVPSNNSRLSVGEEFDVAIHADNVSDLYGYALRLNYDANSLMLLHSTSMAATEGVFLKADNPSLFFATEQDTGLSRQITVVGSMTGNADGVTGSGIVANLRFRVVSDTPGTISLSNVEVADVNDGYNLLPYQQLFIQAAPKTTVALQNYPNPFNPETWIPFHLADDAQVTIKIYNLSGSLVRMIDLGKKSTGYYVSQSQAAYWNGRNEYGELVSSGVYFYTIQAGNYTATKKMMVLK